MYTFSGDRMSRTFLSHASIEEREAIALKQWLADNGWYEVFLDMDSERGPIAGERWQEAPQKAADHCEALRAWHAIELAL